MDFTLLSFSKLLTCLLNNTYSFSSFKSVLENNIDNPPISILRHDVDRRPFNSLITAKLEHNLGIKGTYYFRIFPESFDEKIIKKISSLGHEIGYHYEEVNTVYKSKAKSKKLKVKGDDLIDEAYKLFCSNLKKIREIADIKTICMHGSPLSPFDNKSIWKKYDYRKLGIIGEPYFDLNFNEFAYLTDTGRRWNGDSVSVRDRVGGEFKFNFKSTQDIINNIDKLPNKIMLTIHPQRWNDNFFLWSKEFVLQNMKNSIKKMIVKKRKRENTN